MAAMHDDGRSVAPPRRRTRRRRGALLLAVCAGWALMRFSPFPEQALRPPSSTVVLDRHGEPLRVYLAPDEMWRLRVSLDEVAPDLVEAVLAYEDRHFFRHPGIDPLAVMRAVWANLSAGRVVQGASTLTMQVARLMEPKPRYNPQFDLAGDGVIGSEAQVTTVNYASYGARFNYSFE